MRRIQFVLVLGSVFVLAACGGSGSSKPASPTTTPLPAGCPAQTLMSITSSTGTVEVAAATRKAVTRKNYVTVYLFAKLLNQPDTDFTKFIGGSFRIDGDGAMIASGKNSVTSAQATTGSYTLGKNPPLQLLEYSVQQSGKLVTPTPAKPPAGTVMEITTHTNTLVCGTISGPQGSTAFIADRVSAD